VTGEHDVTVTVRAARQVVTDNGQHHYGGDNVTVNADVARTWASFGWVEPVEPHAEAGPAEAEPAEADTATTGAPAKRRRIGR